MDMAEPGRQQGQPGLRVTSVAVPVQHGGDAQARMPLPSTYLGHSDPKATYWYLSATPELLALAANRLEVAFGGQP
jgi:hypothetical protein